jgi:tRNA dimethylallyltransferase
MKKVIIITGPTASGKSSVALSLAKKIDGEIVSADSMQVYRKMNIGTAKPTKNELNEVKHHMIDICGIDQDYSVAQYKEQATDSINDIIYRKKTPIITGGTGLYLDSLIYNIDFKQERQSNREYYEQYLKNNGKDSLYNLLLQRDPDAALSTHPNNTKRVIRYLDILSSFEGTLEEYKKAAIGKNTDFDFNIYLLHMQREQLYRRIEKRVDEMLDAGLVEEVKGILNDGYSTDCNALTAIGYKKIAEYLRGFCTYDEMVNILKKNTRNYAKRQITWFKRYEEARIINIRDYIDADDIAEFIREDVMKTMLKEEKNEKVSPVAKITGILEGKVEPNVDSEDIKNERLSERYVKKS